MFVRMGMKRFCAAAVLLLTVSRIGAEDKALAPTPPMGWNSWDSYGLTVNEAQVLHLVFDLSRNAAAATAGARVTVVDSQGAAVYSQFVSAGDVASANLFLRPGVYGVAVGGLFAGESMFTRVRDASKVALVHLMNHLRRRGYRLFDVQYLNDHTAGLGAVEIPRREYLARLRRALACDVTFG